MLILSDNDVSRVLETITQRSLLTLLGRLHESLRRHSAERGSSEVTVHLPHREYIATKDGNTSVFMPCSITTSTAIKIVTISPKGIKGCVNVFSPDGELLGLLNGEQLTAFRTALVSMIPFQWFPHKKASILVFGAGKQAEWHIKLALLLSKDITNVTVVNRSSPRGIKEVFESLRGAYPSVSFNVLLKSDSEYQSRLQHELGQSDVIFGCTPSEAPHFLFADLDKSKVRLIALIGSYKPSMHEIDTETLLSGGRVMVDNREGCLIESGELIDAGLKDDDVDELGELDSDGPSKKSNENYIFKCVGFALLDIVVAHELLPMAKEQGIGLEVPNF
jgi:ornithine cyclodeaminase/alanine dehydrogenase-like protein (mu-crystallin family)